LENPWKSLDTAGRPRPILEVMTTATLPFKEAPRTLGLTRDLEKRALLWMAARVPRRIGSDHLTGLGFGAMAAASLAYAGSARYPSLLLVANVLLFVNWVGDSLDGTLARFRGHTRPRYGFYVDHLLDSVASSLLVGGLALSGLVTPLVAGILLVLYLLVSIESYLATYTVGEFKIAHGGVGGTELRLMLVAMNSAVYLTGGATVLGMGLFEGFARFACAGLLVTLLAAGFQHGNQLFDAEPLPGRGGGSGAGCA
jgi:archaetidylinositol phosphate synthase